MKTAAHALCLLAVLSSWTGAYAAGLDDYAPPMNGTGSMLGRITAMALANANSMRVAISCSSSSVSAYGPNSGAVAYASSSSKAIHEAASACSQAIVQIYRKGRSSGKCSFTDAQTQIYAAATACARASIGLRADAYAKAASRGFARANAYSCAWSAASSQTMAQAIVQGYATAWANQENKETECAGFSQSDANFSMASVVKACTSGLAVSFVTASTYGRGSAKARSSAVFQSDVSVYAKIMGDLTMRACSKCSYKCSFCDKYIAEGENTTTDSLSYVSGSRLAAASAMSDVAAAVCKGGKDPNQQTIKIAAKTLLEAITQVCVQMTAYTHGWVKGSGNAIACEVGYASGNGLASAEVYGNMLADAVTSAFGANACMSQAWATISANITKSLSVDVFLAAYQKTCKATVATPGGGSKLVAFKKVADSVVLPKVEELADAVSFAIGAAVQACGCKGAGFCCDCAPEERDCPFDYTP